MTTFGIYQDFLVYRTKIPLYELEIEKMLLDADKHGENKFKIKKSV